MIESGRGTPGALPGNRAAAWASPVGDTEFSRTTSSVDADARRAHLLAAARAARAWALERRALWTDPPADAHVTPAPGLPFSTPPVLPISMPPPPADAPGAAPVDVIRTEPDVAALPSVVPTVDLAPSDDEQTVPPDREIDLREPVAAGSESFFDSREASDFDSKPSIEVRAQSSLDHPDDDHVNEDDADEPAMSAEPTSSAWRLPLPGIGASVGTAGHWAIAQAARYTRAVIIGASVLVIVGGLGWTGRHFWRQRALAPKTGTLVI